MPIRIIEDGKDCKPVLACDHCGQVITHVRDGKYQCRFDGLAFCISEKTANLVLTAMPRLG